MDNAMRTMAETAAQLLLRAYRSAHPEWVDDRTPVDALAEWLKLDVETFHPSDYPEGTYGFMDADEDENLIWLRRTMQETLRRFTLAHELGHAILHCQGGKRFLELSQRFTSPLETTPSAFLDVPLLSRIDPCHEADVQENLSLLLDEEQFEEKLGIGHTYDPRSQRELAANFFAAELLIPFDRLRTLYLVEQVPAPTIAARFGISNAALLNRLAELLQQPVARSETEPLASPQPAAAANTTAKRYDEFQQAAIEAETPALIVAGPGSGKTSTLIGRAIYLIRERNLLPQQILALTFSRKAASEMEERLQHVLSADYPTLPKVSTFHAFCADLLRQHGHLIGLRKDFALIDEAEGYFMLRQQANDLRLRHYQKLQAPAFYFPDILKAISRAKDELITPEDYAELGQRMQAQASDPEALEQAEKALEVAHVYALYQQALQQRGDTDFGGLLMLAIELLRQQPALLTEIQWKYQQILVDEFQDVNRASGVLLRTLAGSTQNVWVVGDSNQAIYGFRGASSANISQFEQDFPGARVLPLSRNYRSRPDLVALAEAFRCVQLELGQEPGKNQPVRLPQNDAYVTLARASHEIYELAGIAQDIQFKHSQGYAYRDMIVLCRTRAQAQKISRTLAAQGLPIVEQGGMLEQEHIRDVLSILMLLTNNSGMGLLRAGRQPEHPLSQHDIEALLLAAREPQTNLRQLLLDGEAPLTMSAEGRHALIRIAQILHSAERSSDVWSFLAQYLLIETPLIRNLLETVDKAKQLILTDYARLLQLARHYDQQQPLHPRKSPESAPSDMPEKPALVEQLRGFLEYLSLLVLLKQEGGSRQSSEEDENEQSDIIRVMTVHASKGLEFPVVYLPYLVQQKFPLQARTKPVANPSGMLPVESEGSAAHENGEACLFYVGVTRARDQLILSYSESYGKRKYKRSPYLDALEAGINAERFSKIHWDEKTTKETVISEEKALPFSSQPSDEFVKAMRSPTLSINAIEAYQRCPREYAYNSIYHFTSDENTYRLFWQATRNTVEELQQQLEKASEESHQRIPTQEEIQELYSQHWNALGGPEALFAPLYEEHGHEVVEQVRQRLTVQHNLIWKLHQSVKVDVGGQKIHVTIDRIEEAEQSGEATKYIRTSFGKRKEKPTAGTRELFYTLGYRQQYPGQNVELYSHNMSTGETTPITISSKKELSLYESVKQAIEGLEQQQFPAQPDPFRCPTCPFFFICPA
ncbi:UvrD-helicase domain-containing protein [Tengunoibacter tsumagoiensis]|uniref:DNA 3'-5' helicase n=1 Tax=Tengunoibacter tsumagoiensis TaxID=2014871 RepID=A0A402A5M6_9CHLR|nr:UvrD-helicase domain-containing protein [Tengunoibacter tsumagoiensis]GCE14356.1 DNA helicase [Tengunoibacter tsumagoiensis]